MLVGIELTLEAVGGGGAASLLAQAPFWIDASRSQVFDSLPASRILAGAPMWVDAQLSSTT
jgi:hypothetical protein